MKDTHKDVAGALAVLRTASEASDPVVIARAFFEARPELFAALERSRVVVALDEWADRIDNLRWECWPDAGPQAAVNLINDREKSVRAFYAASTDEARADAVRAIEAREV